MAEATEKTSRFSDHRFAVTLSTVFLIIGAVIAWHHEMWRDEMQAWLIARDAPSVIELFKILKRYEGHPSVWHLGLYVLQFFTSSPIIMQPYHLIIATATIFVFSRFSPFTRLQKTLFAFGYFPFYEYAIICRNYAIGILLLCLFCTLFSRWKQKFPLVGLILFVLAHTSVHALIIVMSIALFLILEVVIASERPSRTHMGIGFALILTGIGTAIYQIAPAADQGTRPGWTTAFDWHHLQNVLNLISRVFFAIPRSMMHFWNTNFLDPIPNSAQIKLVLSVLILLFVIGLLLRKPTVLLMYLCGTTGLLAFFYTKYFGSVRHHGFLFMLFIAAVWISHYSYEARRLASPLKATSWGLARAFNIVFVVVLLIHAVGGVTAAKLELTYPFSTGKAVARFIKEEANLEGMLIAGAAPDDLTLEVLGYLEKDEFFYPRSDRFGSFGVWDMAWRDGRNLHIVEVLRRVQRLADERGEDILIVSARPFSAEMERGVPRVSAPLEIGRTEGAHYFQGSVDELLIAKRALSQEEINAHYEGGVAAVGPTGAEVILAMPFEEGEGAVTKDNSPYGNHGSLKGANWGEGKFGAALTFDGTAWVDAGNNAHLELNDTDFTIALWASFGANGVNGLVGKSEGPGERNKWCLINRPKASAGGEIVFHLNWPDRPGLWMGLPRQGEMNRWYQIVLVKSQDTCNFYVDGKLIGAIPYPLIYQPPTGYTLTELTRFGPAVIDGEVPQYCVYQLSLPAGQQNLELDNRE